MTSQGSHVIKPLSLWDTYVAMYINLNFNFKSILVT